MSDEIKKEIAKQISEYKDFEHVIRLGVYYSLASPTKYDYAAYYYTTTDAAQFVLTVIAKHNCPKGKTKRLKITAANANSNYVDVRTGRVYAGAELKKGIVVDLTGSTESAHLFHFKDIG